MDQDELLRELRQVFAEELREELRMLCADVAALVQRPGDAELAKSTHRRAHGLKGAARSVGERHVEEACWEVEQRLRPVRDGHSEVTPELLDDVNAGLAQIARAAAPLLGGAFALPKPQTPARAIRPPRRAGPAPAAPPDSLPALPNLVLPDWGDPDPAPPRPHTPTTPRPAGAVPQRPVSPRVASDERSALDVFRSAMDGVMQNLKPSDSTDAPELPRRAEIAAAPLPRPAATVPESAPPPPAALDPGASLIDGTPLWQAWADAMPLPAEVSENGLSADMAAQLRRIFLDELDDHLAALAGDLDELAAAPHRADLIANLFRAAHSLKGAARSAGERGIEAVGHRFEDVLSEIRAGRRAVTVETVGSLRRAVEELADATARLKADGGDGAELYAVAERLEELPAETITPAPVAPPKSAAPGAPAAAEAGPAGATVRVAAERLDTLLARSDELLAFPRRMDDRLEELDALAGLLRHGRVLPAAGAAREQWLKRLEQELAVHRERLAADRRRLATGCDAIRAEAHGLRMQPFADACRTLEATAREVARSSGKDLAVELRGQAALLDRTALDGLKDPLLHLIRNAADHGIETPARRLAAGKPARGALVVSAALLGDRVLVTVADDGAGLDLEALRRRLRRDGVPVPEDDRELARTIFQPGLSTRDQVTAFSGRGVGLDVVKARVEALGGAVDVEFEPGRGTTFLLSLPASLSTRRAVLLRIGEHVVAAPAQHLERLVRVDPASLFAANGRECVRLDGRDLPLAPLSAALRFEAPPTLRDGKLLVVVARHGERRFGLCVDEVLAAHELVVKRLGSRLRRARLLDGSATLPSGRLCLLLNIAETIRAAAESPAGLLLALARNGRAARRRVLVADDSITTRALVKSRLEAAGHVVLTAADGAEAWRLLEEQGADLVVSDLDMPELDGFQLTQRIRQSERWRQLPVVLLTSRDAPADRQRGIEVGATEYLLKAGFDQREMLALVARLLRRGVRPAAAAAALS